MKRTYLLASTLLLVAVLAAAWQNSRHPDPVPLTPSLTGQTEYCGTCHADVPDISPSHPNEIFGCVRCHGGQPLALEANLAHSTMRGGRNPSDLSVVEASCGGSDCHSGGREEERDHNQRVLTSVQATYAGAIAHIRYTFGAQPDPVARLGIYAVQDETITSSTGISALEAFDPGQESSPSVIAFARNCLTCHLSADPLPGVGYARLTGCAACHTPTAGMDLEQENGIIHRLSTAIPYTQCNTCHNQGNYDLRDLQFHPRADHPTNRLEDYYQPIAQFVRCEWTLDCVDCHTRTEAMGDGDLHSSKKDIQYVQCRTCHGTLEELPMTRQLDDPDDLALRLAFLNPVIDLKVGDTILITEEGEPLWNTRQLADGNFELYGKASGDRFTFRPVKGTACEQNPDQQESKYCHVCHAVEK